METLNTYLDPIEEGPCPECAALPDDTLCQSCEWVQPCDHCGGPIAFRDVASGALLCRPCTQRLIEEEEPLESRRRAFVVRYAHSAIDVAALTALMVLGWVTFQPTLGPDGATLHGTVTSAGAIVLVGNMAGYFIGHGVIEHFWPERP
jgi:hypothetical protein